MKRYLIKICGNKYVNNLIRISQLSVDYVGFNFDKSSPYYVENNLIFSIHPNAFKVGIFVNESIEIILQKVKDYQLDVVQLNGDEDFDFCQKLRALNQTKKIELWKMIPIDFHYDFEQLTAYEHIVNNFVFYLKPERYSQISDFKNESLLTSYKLSTPFFITINNALKDGGNLKKHPHPRCIGVDLLDEFETEIGIKNSAKILEFQEIINS